MIKTRKFLWISSNDVNGDFDTLGQNLFGDNVFRVHRQKEMA